MKTDDNSTRSSQEPKATGSSANATEAEPRREGEQDVLLDLVREFNSLSESGKNEARLRELRRAIDAERLRRIDKALTILEKDEASRLPELTQICTEFSQALKAETKRTDLTVPEELFLSKLIAQQIREEEKRLLTEKDRIVRNYLPAKHRQRGTT